jgi:DNA primase
MPGASFSRAQLDAIKQQSDLVAVAREQGIVLKRRGRTYFGLCPFHAEQTASFAVSRDAGLFHCFGCGIGGDVIRFVERTQQVLFPEAVRRLAHRAGLPIDDGAGSDDR